MKKYLKSFFVPLVIFGTLTGCKSISFDGETSTGVNWWLTAIFCFCWLFFSCPLVSSFVQIMSGDAYADDDEDVREAKFKFAGTSVYAFPAMLCISSVLNKFVEWHTNYLISIVVGFIIGAIIRKQRNPLCNGLIHQTKLLWIGQGVMTIISIILALTV